LGLAENVASQLPLDYHDTVQNVYTKATEVIFSMSESKEILSLAGTGTGRRMLPGLPSWVPDFSLAVRHKGSPLGLTLGSTFFSPKAEYSAWEFGNCVSHYYCDRDVLTLAGVKFDTIESMSRVLKDIMENDSWTDWLRGALYVFIGSRYCHEQIHTNKWWHSLVGDRSFTHNGTPIPPSRELFRIYLKSLEVAHDPKEADFENFCRAM
jgi:hypothetical protein